MTAEATKAAPRSSRLIIPLGQADSNTEPKSCSKPEPLFQVATQLLRHPPCLHSQSLKSFQEKSLYPRSTFSILNVWNSCSASKPALHNSFLKGPNDGHIQSQAFTHKMKETSPLSKYHVQSAIRLHTRCTILHNDPLPPISISQNPAGLSTPYGTNRHIDPTTLQPFILSP